MNNKKKTQVKRKVLAVLLAAVMFGGSAAVTLPVLGSNSGIVANAATYGDFEYEENDDGGITITEYTGSDAEVVIPSEIDGKSVTSIDRAAFSGCTSLTSVTIPDSVTILGKRAFGGCKRLKSIIIPNGMTSIGDEAFYDCTSLTSVSIPDSVTSIGGYAFSRCTGLTSVTIPDSVTSIGYGAFDGCTSLINVMIPDSVTSIGDYAFRGCTSLTSISVGENNENYSSVDGVLFNKDKTTLICCPGGKSGTYTIPDGVTSIEVHAFYGCTNLINVTIPDSVTSIGSSAFYGCTSLTSITIPDSVTSIGGWAFYGCTRLTSINIPNSVTNIGYAAFCGCTSLTSVTIPQSVTSIYWFSFGYSSYYDNDAGSGGEKIDGFTIYGKNGSEAETYANENEFRFIDPDNYVYETKLELNQTELSLEAGKTRTLTVTVTPENATDKTVTWTSSDEKVVTVDENGKVTAVTTGTATITAKSVNGITATCEVTVKDPVVEVTKIELNKTELSLEKRKTETLTATLTPDNATDKTVTWTSSDTNVATVENGKITAVAAGTATITATTANGLTATATVTVTEPAPTLTDINKATVSGIANKTYTGKNITQSITVKLGDTTLKNDTDYTVAYKNNKNVGTATVTITGKGNYTGKIEKTFTINKAKINTAAVTVAAQTYTGKALTPAPTVKIGSATLKKGTDYKVTYSSNTNAGTAKVTITGQGNYTGTVTKSFKISAKSTSKLTTKLSATSYVYNGKAKTPTVTLKDGTKTLKKGTDYTVTYSSNKAIGTAKVTIKGKGNYTGTITKTFKIVPKTTTLKTVTSPKTKQLKATWAKDTTVTGYQIQYSTNSKFTSGNKTKKISKNTTTSATIGSLTKGKTYYVRIRSYKKVGTTTIYGNYSTVKKVKIK